MLDAQSGKVIGNTSRCHRSIGFRKFLDLIDAAVLPDCEIHPTLALPQPLVLRVRADTIWPLPTCYDDTSPAPRWRRPALQRLLPDIEAERIDVIVVYKADRLTRALSDFSSRSSIAATSPSSQ